MSLNALNASEVDHYTPLSRAVASIDRDAYAARFAIYDRAHKALLRRLATAVSPPSAADVEREEQAFRDAVRRVEFSQELAEEHGEEAESPALVPQREPDGEAALQELRREAPWPEVRPHRESLGASSSLRESLPDFAPNDPDIPLAALLGPRRSVMRRVGERLALAVVVLALGGVWLWVAEGRQQGREQAGEVTPASTATSEAAAPDSAPVEATRPPRPGWLSSPELFYSAPQLPTAPASAAPAGRPAPAPRRP